MHPPQLPRRAIDRDQPADRRRTDHQTIGDRHLRRELSSSQIARDQRLGRCQQLSPQRLAGLGLQAEQSNLAVTFADHEQFVTVRYGCSEEKHAGQFGLKRLI